MTPHCCHLPNGTVLMEAEATRSTGNLFRLASAQMNNILAIELQKRREDDPPDLPIGSEISETASNAD